jgi:hypothetical protein
MRNDINRARHAELALSLASQDQRLLDAITQRPHLLNPYPSIVTRLSRRSRRFRKKVAGDREPRTPVLSEIPWRGTRPYAGYR